MTVSVTHREGKTKAKVGPGFKQTQRSGGTT